MRQRSTSLETRRARNYARNVRPSRAANNDPHPHAPGALALSLSGARDLELEREWEKEDFKRQRASYAYAKLYDHRLKPVPLIRAHRLKLRAT